VRAVCREAGLSSRYFYESFANLDELLLAVFDGIMSRTIERVTAAMAVSDRSVRGLIEALSSAFVEMTLDDPRATRVGFIEAWNSEPVMRRRVQTLHSCAGMLAAAVTATSERPTVDRAAIEVAAFVLVGGLLETILGWLDGALTVDRDTLIWHYSAAGTAAMEQALQCGHDLPAP
jgi:AcrR family transcriptional regulator